MKVRTRESSATCSIAVLSCFGLTSLNHRFVLAPFVPHTHTVDTDLHVHCAIMHVHATQTPCVDIILQGARVPYLQLQRFTETAIAILHMQRALSIISLLQDYLLK